MAKFSALLGLIFLLGVFAPAVADDCPADRPIKRVVADLYATRTCTLLACMGRLVCPQDGGRCAYMANDCNRCSEPPEREICLTREELDKAILGR